MDKFYSQNSMDKQLQQQTKPVAKRKATVANKINKQLQATKVNELISIDNNKNNEPVNINPNSGFIQLRLNEDGFAILNENPNKLIINMTHCNNNNRILSISI